MATLSDAASLSGPIQPTKALLAAEEVTQESSLLVSGSTSMILSLIEIFVLGQVCTFNPLLHFFLQFLLA